MNDLADNSNLVTITKIGESYLKNNQGRANSNFDIPTNGHDIYAIVVTDSSVSSNNKGKALFTSGVHAREYAPPELLARFLERLVEGFGTDAEVTSILQHTEVHGKLFFANTIHSSFTYFDLKRLGSQYSDHLRESRWKVGGREISRTILEKEFESQWRMQQR